MRMFTDPQVALVPIEIVLDLSSVDSEVLDLPEGSTVADVLDVKRLDSWYPALLLKVEREGLISPLCCNEAGFLTDGHHRVACAVDLGWTHVPLIQDGGCHYDDPSDWGAERYGWTGFNVDEESWNY